MNEPKVLQNKAVKATTTEATNKINHYITYIEILLQ